MPFNDKLDIIIILYDCYIVSKNFKNPQTLMVQGATSDAGKSIVVTALCRILAKHGISVAPFKPQNMALNSAVTANGGEIGRAQAVQANACYLAPDILMNPVLLKPNSDTGSQVIVHGKAIGNMDAVTYHAYKPKLLDEVVKSHQQLAEKYEAVVVEGAGSPAEINLREHDIANMGFAEAIDCPVIIVADIDRGGVFAHLAGTYELLSESERQRVIGFVINRFRGDVSLLHSGNEWLEQRYGVPVLAVLPYIQQLHIEAEDSVNASQLNLSERKIKVVIPKYPRASNHTDFDILRMHPNVDCEFIIDSQQFSGADLIILPGSKHVRADLAWLKETGWQKIIEKHLRYGGKLMGICGGYQMLGRWVHDPSAVESEQGSSQGLALIDMETTLSKNKTLRNVSGESVDKGLSVKGYEIHAGESCGNALKNPLFKLQHGNEAFFNDGAISADGLIKGTYLHGVFDQSAMLEDIIQWVDATIAVDDFDYTQFKDQQINRLAEVVEKALPVEKIFSILGMQQENAHGR